MVSSVPSRVAAVTLLVGLTVGCVEMGEADRGPGAGAPGSVPLRVVAQDGRALAFVPVTVGDQGPFLFALDTGASVTTVDVDVAEQLHLTITGERQVTGIAGSQWAEMAQVEHWRMGDIALAPTEIALLDLPDPEGTEGLRGLLGSDVLSGFGEIVIDYDEEVLRLPQHRSPS